MYKLKLAIIIPTKDRPKDLESLFNSLIAQTRIPDQIIVVDGSDNPIKSVVDKFSARLAIDYIPVRPPSLPKQRNVGVKNLKPNIQWVGFLDDDLVLENNTIEELEDFIEAQNNGNLKGVGLKIINQPVSKVSLFNNLFMLAAGQGGKITRSGFASAIPPVKSTLKVDWLYGGATFWDMTVFEIFSYDEWFQGTGYMEDVDFSYGVSRIHDLAVSSRAACYHYHHPISRSKQKGIGEWQITSWWYFVTKYKNFKSFYIAWSMFGLFLKNTLIFLLKSSPDAGLRSLGNLKGFIFILTGKALKQKGFSK